MIWTCRIVFLAAAVLQVSRATLYISCFTNVMLSHPNLLVSRPTPLGDLFYYDWGIVRLWNS